jgi:hypothetical protein
MNTLWMFRALYTARHEFWFTHLRAVCAFRVIFHLDSGLIQVDTFSKAIQGLYELSERFNIAKDVVSSLQKLVQEQKLEIPRYASGLLKSHAIGSTPSVMQHTAIPGHGRFISIAEIVGETNQGAVVD